MASEQVYHVWFATKGRKWLLVGDLGDLAKAILVDAAREKEIDLLECQTMVDHVHILVGVDSSPELSRVMKLLKGRSAFELFRRNPGLKLDAGINAFWQRGFNARLVPREQTDTVRRYIRTQDDRLEKYER